MRLFWCALMLAVPLGLLALSCATAMRSVGCSKLPTVEECRRAARRITNQCLRTCVVAQCSGVTVRCGDRRALAKCGEPRALGKMGGFVDSERTETCQVPLDEMRWCDLPLPASCRPLVMVHELAHTCGWDHDAGMGVPGEDGVFMREFECD